MALQCLEKLLPFWEHKGVSQHEYQIKAAETLLDEMAGSGILADEVGLGKTIEAGLIVSELVQIRKMKRVLVLAPASLLYQWQAEMRDKFELQFDVNPEAEGFRRLYQVIASLDYAKREDQAKILRGIPWDVVVVDEAHRLKNQKTRNYQLVQSLSTTHLVLLTATPMENELNELYNLVHLVKPDLFGSYMSFYKRFILDKRTPKNREELQALLQTVMVRNKRGQVGLHLPDREVHLVPVKIGDGERHLYQTLTNSLREQYKRRTSKHLSILPLLTLQRELCSSHHALKETLGRIGTDWLGDQFDTIWELCNQVQVSEKEKVLLEIVRKSGERTIVFTEFRATQEALAERLREHGLVVFLYHGQLPQRERRAILQQFASSKEGVLIATEAGGQGLNLQHCHRLVNYDMPWNPMRIEQRIGRVHRLGQTQTVEIYNLYATATIEEKILTMLYIKIDLFRNVIGELDVILRRFETEQTFEGRLLAIALGEENQESALLSLADQWQHLHDKQSLYPDGKSKSCGDLEKAQ